MKNIRTQVLLRFGSAPLVFGLIFFLPAGSFRFWEAWVYMGLILIPMFFIVLYFLKKDPTLLERRMRTREKEKEQYFLHAFFGLFVVAGFLLPGFDFRWHWSQVPIWLIVAAEILVFLGYMIFFLVMRENSYLSRTVEVDKGQPVITTGPYRVVRHPMYTAVLLMFFFTPIALGSWWALIPMIPLPVILVLRILTEEKVLIKELSGYAEYRKTVRFRLIPYIW
ncbi:MAG: isoprenylcysteine carboxylmethyltransferase family protein [Candidatus Aminicenantes bacterium]|nr:isoprenylcysteine carboxylmethyltransferase family protein [Candidatus Aminicenantes bacterium]